MGKALFRTANIKTTYKARQKQPVEATGEEFGTNIIVAQHPERKKQEPIVKSIISCLS